MVSMLFSQYNFHESWAADWIKRYINTHDKVLIIPFSFRDNINNEHEWENAYSSDNGKYYQSIIHPFVELGIREENIKWLNYFQDTKEEAKRKIKDGSILFFTGGLPDKMMERLKEFDLIEEIQQFNGVIIGSSAGAMVQLAEYHISPDEDYDTFSYQKGLGRIQDIGIEVHFDNSEEQIRYIHKVLEEKLEIVYGISDHGGIIVDDGKTDILGDVMTFSRPKMANR